MTMQAIASSSSGGNDDDDGDGGNRSLLAFLVREHSLKKNIGHNEASVCVRAV